MAGPVRLVWNEEEFSKGLARAAQGIKIRSTKDLQALGIDVQNQARRFCPVDTGRLRSSIQHQMGEDAQGPYVVIGTNVEYAPYVEFGTLHQRARPYLRPALARAISRRLP